MKHLAISIILSIAAVVAMAQEPSTNPLNYSGKMYLTAIEYIKTPRYVSYEDHAILSTEIRVPTFEVTICEMDFEKGMITVDETKMNVKVLSTKKYEDDFGWTIVIYMENVKSKDKMELVWPQYKKPYLQTITKRDNGVDIARMILTDRP